MDSTSNSTLKLSLSESGSARVTSDLTDYKRTRLSLRQKTVCGGGCWSWTKVCFSPSCESRRIGCCVCPAHLPGRQSHTRTGFRQTSASSCQISSSSWPLLPPRPHSPHCLRCQRCGRDLRSASGRGLGYGATTFDRNKEKKFTWIAAPAAPPPPASPAPPVRWRTACCLLESQIQHPWRPIIVEFEPPSLWGFFTSDFSLWSSVLESLGLGESGKGRKTLWEPRKRKKKQPPFRAGSPDGTGLWITGLRWTLDFWGTQRKWDVLTWVLHSHEVLRDHRKQNSET